MVKMPWNRNRTRPTAGQVPAEVEEYYQSTRKQRRSVALLLGFATLALTLVLAVLLFFGGRWVYQQLFSNNDNTQTETTQPSEQPVDSGQAAEEAPSDTNPDEALPESETSESTNPETNTSDSTSDSGSTTTPTTGPSEPEIPRTGPTEE
jgi:cytoskeletal protein RodZ